MSERKHSPTPWRVADERSTEYTGACVLDSKGRLVADCNIFGFGPKAPSEQECMENAIRIAIGVNAHDDLLEVCKHLLHVFKRLHGTLVCVGDAMTTLDCTEELAVLQTTIAKAEEVPADG